MILQGNLGFYEIFVRKVGTASAELVLYRDAKYKNKWQRFCDHPTPVIWQSPGSEGKLWKRVMNFSVEEIKSWCQEVIAEYETYQDNLINNKVIWSHES